jgi:hypothetical protein
MRFWRESVLVLLLASVIVPTAPDLIKEVRRAVELRSLSMNRRREIVLGDFYRGIEELQKKVPPDEPLALITHPQDFESGFINYDLYPHPTRIYWSRWQYAFADPKTRPKLIVRSSGVPQLMTYAELRDAELKHSRVLGNLQLPAETRTRFAIPIVTSSDGPPQDSYTVEGALASDDEANVTLTLQPFGIVKKMTIRGTYSFYDLVYEAFGKMEFAAWVSVSSDRPIRAAFWLVNHRPRTAAPIVLVNGPLRAPEPLPTSPTARLWLLNLGDEHVVARAGTHDALVPPRTLMSVAATGTVSGPVFAFLSEREPNGQTRFVWPASAR